MITNFSDFWSAALPWVTLSVAIAVVSVYSDAAKAKHPEKEKDREK